MSRNFTYRWRDVLEPMLSPKPEDRPLKLSDLPQQLKLATANRSIPVRRGRGIHARLTATVVLLAAALLSAPVAIFALRSKSKTAPTPVPSDIRQMFSARAIYRAYVEQEQPLDEVAARFNVSKTAVYKIKSRVEQMAAIIEGELI